MGVDQIARPAVFLDRDGVLNEVIVRDGHPYPPEGLADLRIYPEVATNLARLKEAGFVLVVVTNQPDVARGVQTRAVVDAMNAQLSRVLPLDETRVCYHDDADGCNCRKPLPGLLTAVPCYDLPRSYMVGDRWRDVEAGQRAGCRTVFIDRGYDEPVPAADTRVRTLTEAVDWILQTSEK